MCLTRAEGKDLEALENYVNGTNEYRLAEVEKRKNAILEFHPQQIAWEKEIYEANGVPFPSQERCKDTCSIPRSTAGDTEYYCNVCFNIRADLDEWLHRSIMFRAYWSKVPGAKMDTDIFAPAYIAPPKLVSNAV